MAQRDASVRLSLNAGSFAGGLRDLSRQVDAAGKQMGKAMSKPLQEGFSAGRNAAKGLLSDIRGALTAAASLGGALAAGDSAKRAIELQSAYGQVAFQIEVATGKVTKLADIQKAVSNAALETSRTHEELADSMKVMLDRGADPTFALKSLASVGQLMNTTGMDAERTGRLMAGLSKMYGMNADEAAASLDAVMATASKSGATVEELFEDFTEFGSLAKGAGMGGKDGFNLMMSVLAKMGPKLNGTTSEMSAGLDIFLERMRDVAVMEATFKAGKGKFNKGEFIKLDNAVDQAKYLMKAGPEVMAAFKESFTGREEKVAFEAFFGPYFDTLNTELAAKKGKTTAKAAAIASVEANITSMSAGFEDAGRVAGASAREQESAAAKLRTVQNTLADAMAKPSTLEALNKLATQLPKVAEGMVKLISFVVENPLLAGGMYAGGRVGGAAAGGAMGQMPGLALSGGKALGKEIATSFASQVATQGKWATIGKTVGAAAGIAIAAAVAYELGKEGIDKINEMGGAAGKEKFAADMEAFNLQQKVRRQGGAATPADVAKAKELEAALTKQNTIGSSAVGGFGGGALDGVLNTTGIGSLMQMLFASSEKSNAGQGSKASVEESRATIEYLRNLGNAARTATTELQKVKGATTGSNGLPPQPGNEPGAG